MSKVLVFGASGMLGSTVFKVFSEDKEFGVFGTARNDSVKGYFCLNSGIISLQESTF